MIIKTVGVANRNGIKFRWARGVRGSGNYDPIRNQFLGHKIRHQIGMSTKSAGPSIFARQARMGVGRTPLHQQ